LEGPSNQARMNKNKEQPMISVVLSFFHEEGVLPELIQRLRDSLQPLRASGAIRDYELLFVNDSSTDRSIEVLLEEQGKHPDIIVVNMSRNFGNSECVLAGLAQSKGDAVVYMDADLQDPPELIPEMIKSWKDDAAAEVVYTTRRSRAGEHPLKLLITKFGYRLINKISEIPLPIDSGDFKLLSRRAVTEVLMLQEKQPYMRGLVSWVGFKQVQVFYDRAQRFDGRVNTKFPVLSRRVLSGYLDKALISFSDIPLKIALLLGLFVAMLALLYIFVIFFQKFMGWYEPGWPAIMATMLLLGGTQLIVLGIMGLYINTIFLESKRRPNYIIKDILVPGVVEKQTRSAKHDHGDDQ
jgi:glycosyltransferase involved in cell wall biosynthesis